MSPARKLTQSFSTTNIEKIRNIAVEDLLAAGNRGEEGYKLAKAAMDELVRMGHSHQRWDYLKKLRDDPRDGRLATFLIVNGFDREFRSLLTEYHQNERIAIMSGNGVVDALAQFSKRIWLKENIIQQPSRHREMMLKESENAVTGMIEHGFADEMIDIIRKSPDKVGFLSLPLIFIAFEKMKKVEEVKEIISMLPPAAKIIIYLSHSQGSAYQGDLNAFGLIPPAQQGRALSPE